MMNDKPIIERLKKKRIIIAILIVIVIIIAGSVAYLYYESREIGGGGFVEIRLGEILTTEGYAIQILSYSYPQYYNQSWDTIYVAIYENKSPRPPITPPPNNLSSVNISFLSTIRIQYQLYGDPADYSLRFQPVSIAQIVAAGECNGFTYRYSRSNYITYGDYFLINKSIYPRENSDYFFQYLFVLGPKDNHFYGSYGVILFTMPPSESMPPSAK
ncbi:MAG: hypothetical protein QXE18_06395 [Thermoplasmata archaeon]